MPFGQEEDRFLLGECLNSVLGLSDYRLHSSARTLVLQDNCTFRPIRLRQGLVNVFLHDMKLTPTLTSFLPSSPGAPLGGAI